ncbi:unnamed protein product, partial [Allacma fusca]
VWLPLISNRDITQVSPMAGRTHRHQKPRRWFDLSMQLGDATVAFVLGALNSSGHHNYMTKIYPTVEAISNFCSDCPKFLTGASNAFKFITPHNVFSTKESLGLFLRPFRPILWYLIVIFAALVTLLIFALSGVHTGRNLGNSLFFIVSTLFEESYCSIEFGLRDSERRVVRFRNFISAHWMLTMVVVLNAYKGALKADFSAPSDP